MSARRSVVKSVFDSALQGLRVFGNELQLDLETFGPNELNPLERANFEEKILFIQTIVESFEMSIDDEPDTEILTTARPTETSKLH